LAVLCDQGEVARYLIENGARINARAKDRHGGTPLHWAAALGRLEMARRLIDAGADLNAGDNDGFTPLDAANYESEIEKQAKREIADLLRQRGGKNAAENRQEPVSD
jgi:ankyrin repeat protein